MYLTLTIYYTIISKIQKIQKQPDRQKQCQPKRFYPTDKPCIISKLLNENRRRRCILQLLYIIPKFQNFNKFAKIQK